MTTMKKLKMTRKGKPVYAANKDLEACVTKEDIAKGTPLSIDACAMAICLTRMYKCLSAEVGRSRIYLEYDSHWVMYGVPAAVRTEIMAFDRGGQVMPDTYYLQETATEMSKPVKAHTLTTIPKHDRDRIGKSHKATHGLTPTGRRRPYYPKGVRPSL